MFQIITGLCNGNVINTASASMPTCWLRVTNTQIIQLFDRWTRSANCWFLTMYVQACGLTVHFR